MKKKLLILVSPQGEAMVRDIAEMVPTLAERYDVRVLSAARTRRALQRAGVAFFDWRPSGFIGMGMAISRLRRTATAFAPDIVHAHGLPAIAVALGTFPAALASRTIATFHDPQRDKELPQKLVERKLPAYLRRAAAITATYPSLARAYENRFALDPDSIVIVPHAVARPLEIEPRARPANRPGPIVGWRGTLSADRSWETALDAFVIVRADRPHARMEISGVGRARQLVAAYVRQLKLASVVQFSGDIPVADFFARIDLLAVPISRDAQPQALFEALVAGIPVVAANGGALRDALEPFEWGWLVPDDAAGFAEGIADAWSRIDTAWVGAATQRFVARERYSRDVIAAKYESIYAKVRKD